MRVFDRGAVVAVPAGSDLRGVLRAAQAAAQQAHQAAQDAARIAASALAAMDRAKEAVRLHDGLERRVVEWRADLFRLGDVRPDIALPDDLAAARQTLEAAKTAWLTAEGVHVVLQEEVRVAEARAEAAQGAVSAAAIAVMRAEVAGLVCGMHAAEQEAGRLRAVVTGHVAGFSHADQALSPVPPEAAMIGHDPLHAHILELTRADPQAATAAWTAYRRALVLDADAQPPAVLRPAP